MEGQTNRLEGSNAGVGGGVGPVELFMRARYIGVFAGLDADGPVLGGVELSPGSSLALGEVEGVVSCGHGWDKGTEGVPGEHSCVGGHGIVGEQGGVAWRDGGRYGKVGGIDGGGVGGN